jgi:peptide/nickel transport system permease protein
MSIYTNESTISATNKPKEIPRKRITNFQVSVNAFRKSPTAMCGLFLVILLIIIAIAAPWLTNYSPTQMMAKDRFQGPSIQHIAGTDEFGRDSFTRIIYGSRLALQTGLLSVGLSFMIGVPLGLISGFRKGAIDDIIMRLMDGLASFPSLILAIAITAALGYGSTNVIIAIAITYVPTFARIARGQVLSEQEEVYIEAARCIGAKSSRIIFKHLLPNIISPLIVQASLLISSAILAEASLSFLGIGAQPPAPNWGTMLKTSTGFLTKNIWMAIGPGVVLFFTVIGFNFLGDGLRDALDPVLIKK